MGDTDSYKHIFMWKKKWDILFDIKIQITCNIWGYSYTTDSRHLCEKFQGFSSLGHRSSNKRRPSPRAKWFSSSLYSRCKPGCAEIKSQRLVSLKQEQKQILNQFKWLGICLSLMNAWKVVFPMDFDCELLLIYAIYVSSREWQK